MFYSHGPSARGLHLVGNFYRHEPRIMDVPKVRTADGEFIRHLASQSRYFVLGDLSDKTRPLVVDTKAARLSKDVKTFVKGAIAYSTVALATADAEDALANARTPGHRARAQLRLDELRQSADIPGALVAVYYLGNNGHLYALGNAHTAGAAQLGADEVAQVKARLLADIAPITIKGVDATEQVVTKFLERGLIDVDAYVNTIYPDAEEAIAAEHADAILDSAALFMQIRGLEEETQTLDEYVEGYVTDASLLAMRVKDGGFGHVEVSNYERTMNIGESCARLSGVALNAEECRVLHYIVENAMIGKYTSTQEIADVFHDAGDFLQMQGGDYQLAKGRLTFTWSGKSSVAVLPEAVTIANDRLAAMRNAYRKALVNAYRFMFKADNPLLFVWARLGHLYLQPAVKQ